MHALIIGATGATGKDLLQLLLQKPSVQQVTIFVRKPVAINHPRLQVHIINFDEPASWQHFVKGDVLFSCLGTTLKAAGSKEAQWKIDFDYQYQFALAAK
ncbi:MAG: semialdehyde dehydrogenase, partial [Chitinophagaceae bacterium]